MTTLLGTAVASLLTGTVRLLEGTLPMPDRLGSPLPARPRAAASRDPVVLVSGYANNAEGWGEWKRSLEADGFQVFVVDFPTDGLGDMEEAARFLAAFVADVKRRTGRSRVDLVGFSEGGILARMYAAQLGGATSVDRIVTLASPHHGVRLPGPLEAVLRGVRLLREAVPASTWQLLAGSDLLTRLHGDDEQLRRSGPVRYASIFSRTWDLFVTPTSARLEHATNIPVARDTGSLMPGGLDHFSMYHFSNAAYEAARDLLLQ